jgi:hypothetical protein
MLQQYSVKIASLLEADKSAWGEPGLAEVIGDSYLCRYNQLFLSVRRAALVSGATFSCSDSPLWRDYLAFPLVTLSRILEQKTVPYIPNTPVLRFLYERDPDLHLPILLLFQSVKKNFLCHESVHCIAVGVLERYDERLRSLCESDAEATVVSTLLAEAFANAIERLVESQGTGNTHSMFLYLNSYKEYRPQRVAVLRTVTEEIGLSTVFDLATISYFWRNCLNRSNLDHAMDLSATMIFGKPSFSTSVKQMMDMCFRLEDDFVEITSKAHFRMLQCESAFVDFNPERLLANDKAATLIRDILRDMFSAATA